MAQTVKNPPANARDPALIPGQVVWLENCSYLINIGCSVQFSSVAQVCLTLCDPMNHSTPGLSITNFQSLPKLMSMESVMPSNHLILSSPSLSALNLSQNQGLFKLVSSSHQVAKVLELQLQHQS